MSDCARYEETLSLLAARCVSRKDAAPVREHLATCPDCRARFGEYQLVCGALTIVGAQPDVVPSVELSARLEAAIASTESRKLVHVRFRPVVIGTMAAAACVGLALIFNHPDDQTATSPKPRAIASRPAAEPPTVMAYRRAAATSDTALDLLLSRHAESIVIDA